MRERKPKTVTPEPTPAPKKYEPTPYERKVMDAYIAKQDENPPPPAMKFSKPENGDTPSLDFDHPKATSAQVVLSDALGIRNPAFFVGFLKQLHNIGCTGENAYDDQTYNFMIAAVAGVQPRDQVEAMLAAQMAAVHNASMKLARRLSTVDTLEQYDSAERSFNKLVRSFTTQMDALKRYRNEGQQKILVQHTTTTNNVTADQALIAESVVTGGTAHTAPLSLTATAETPMPMDVDTSSALVEVAGGEKRK